VFFERPKSGELAILVHIDMHSEAESDPREFEELAISAGTCPIELITGSRRQVSPRFFIGSGKLEEIQQAVLLHQADVVLFNHSLSSSQERNLEAELQCRVLDRTDLILDIFAQRAQSYEGKLQVELAQLKHSTTRLVKGWSHLDRQKGGIGLRGAGETQLEIDQRLIAVRIKSINQSLKKVRTQRQQGRKARKKAEVPTISLVGYTNAGKSSLFNALTHANIYASDQLFATLDSTLRKIQLPDFGDAILADTVGFIRDLPHQLVDAFRATLEETTEASLLLHVIDCHSEQRFILQKEVNKVLKEIGAEKIPTLMVYNKADLLDADSSEKSPGELPEIERDDNGLPCRVWVSALTGAGIENLLQAISELLGEDFIEPELQLNHLQGRLRAKLYRQGAVKNESLDEQGVSHLSLRLPKQDFIRLLKEEGLDAQVYLP